MRLKIRRRALQCLVYCTGFLLPCAARAESPDPVTIRADDIEYGTEKQSDSAAEALGLKGNVVLTFGARKGDAGGTSTAVAPNRAGASPTARVPLWTLRADALTVRRDRYGMVLRGRANLLFCPCLDGPLRISFDGATASPPSDLFLYSATVRFWSIPVFYTPWAWLRAPDRMGLLPPEISYRGRDGMRLGGGINLPLGAGKWTGMPDPNAPRLELRAGAYTGGGAFMDAIFAPSQREAERGHLALETRGKGGATASMQYTRRSPSVVLSYAVDGRVGARALQLEPDTTLAASPWNRVAFGASYMHSAHGSAVLVGTDFLGRSDRGGRLDAFAGRSEFLVAGSMSRAHFGGAVRVAVGALSADATAPAVRLAPLARTGAAYVRGALEGDLGTYLPGALHAVHVGLGVRASGFAVPSADAPSAASAGRLEAHARVPLGRALGGARLRLEPEVAVGLASHAAVGNAVTNTHGSISPLAVEGAASTRAAFFLASSTPLAVGVSGAFYTRIQTTFAAGNTHGGTSATAGWVGAVAATDTAPIQDHMGLYLRVGADRPLFGARGGFLVTSTQSVFEGALRVGSSRGFEARAVGTLVTGPSELGTLPAFLYAASDSNPSFFPAHASTVGGRVAVPIGPHVQARTFFDEDLSSHTLIDVGAGLRVSDSCRCLSVDLAAQHRLGRSGSLVGANLLSGADVFLGVRFAD